jgi:hypothetical protein
MVLFLFFSACFIAMLVCGTQIAVVLIGGFFGFHYDPESGKWGWNFIFGIQWWFVFGGLWLLVVLL